VANTGISVPACHRIENDGGCCAVGERNPALHVAVAGIDDEVIASVVVAAARDLQAEVHQRFPRNAGALQQLLEGVTAEHRAAAHLCSPDAIRIGRSEPDGTTKRLQPGTPLVEAGVPRDILRQPLERDDHGAVACELEDSLEGFERNEPARRHDEGLVRSAGARHQRP
jgi:hypothetical protein